MVPLEDGTCATIEHLPVTAPTKTLGQMTYQTGSSDGAIVQMKEKAHGWDKAKLSKLINAFLPFLWTNSFGQEFNLESVASARRLMNLKTVLCNYTMRYY